MKKRYGIVYLGSKEKILHLIDYIFQREYKKKNFIDLFAGGLSVSGYALAKTKMDVFANDLNQYIIALYEEILSGGENLEKVKYDWVERELFEDVRDNPDGYEDWYVGFILNVWSFGCDQRSYMYAKDLAENKRALHEAIVNDNFSRIEKEPVFNGFLVPDNVRELDYRKHNSKRTTFMSYFKILIKNYNTYENPYLMEKLEQLKRLEQLPHLILTEHLKTIKHYIKFHHRRFLVESMHYLDYLDMFPTYELENAVIYCDPPYQDTKKYLKGRDFDYEEFWTWFKECPYSVYVSSYKAHEGIEPINFDFKQVKMDNGKRINDRVGEKLVSTENIYWNGKGNAEPTFMDRLFENEI